MRWCLIAGKAADKLNTSLPPSYYFDHAYSWLIKYGITKDQVDIGLFWGRSLVADGEYDKAMSIYAEVLAIAKEKELYNEAGYICTYIADLYDFRDMQKRPDINMRKRKDYLRKREISKVMYLLCEI